jgi:hypothetical protein
VSSDSDDYLEALYNARGITFTLYELNQKDTVSDDYVRNYKEIKLSKGSAYLFEQLDPFEELEARVESSEKIL